MPFRPVRLSAISPLSTFGHSVVRREADGTLTRWFNPETQLFSYNRFAGLKLASSGPFIGVHRTAAHNRSFRICRQTDQSIGNERDKFGFAGLWGKARLHPGGWMHSNSDGSHIQRGPTSSRAAINLATKSPWPCSTCSRRQ